MIATILPIALCILNLVSFLLFGIDKYKSRHNLWRIPEAVLIGSAVLGGSLGALLGMRCFRHKTLHRRFTVGIPMILLLQLAAVYCLL